VLFMAIELLTTQGAIIHKSRHDLESLFYVLIYLCTNVQSPAHLRDVEDLERFQSVPMRSWFEPKSSLMRLGLDKAGALARFRTRILPYFSSYFDDLKPCILALHRALFPTLVSLFSPNDKDELIHDTFINIFDKTLQTLARIDSVHTPILYQPHRTSSRSRKHPLGLHDKRLTQCKRKKSTDRNLSASQDGRSISQLLATPSKTRSCTATKNRSKESELHGGRTTTGRGRKSRSRQMNN
jgi:Fungal protein kinase